MKVPLAWISTREGNVRGALPEPSNSSKKTETKQKLQTIPEQRERGPAAARALADARWLACVACGGWWDSILIPNVSG